MPEEGSEVEVPPHFTVRADDRMRRQIAELLTFYESRADVLRSAVDRLWSIHFPDESNDGEPFVVGYVQILLAQDAICAGSGRTIPAGQKAGREVWSDNREGAIWSLEELKADGIE